MTQRGVKIAIAIPSHETVPVSFAYDLASMMAYTMTVLDDDIEIGINMITGTYVHSARQELLMSLIAQGVSHVLWIDSDMRFPRDALAKLWQHRVDMVGINYSTRGLPPRYVAIKKVGGPTVEEVGEKLVTGPDSTGLEEVDALGFGLVLMSVDVLADMPNPREQPWFWFQWYPERQAMVGEDVFFCKLLRERGVRIFVDHDLSKECKHVGQFEYKLDHVEAWSAATEVVDGDHDVQRAADGSRELARP